MPTVVMTSMHLFSVAARLVGIKSSHGRNVWAMASREGWVVCSNIVLNASDSSFSCVRRDEKS